MTIKRRRALNREALSLRSVNDANEKWMQDVMKAIKGLPVGPESFTGNPAVDVIAGLRGSIADLLYCAFKYDDKPHHLFSTIRRLAEFYETDPDVRREIVRLMDYAHKNKGKPAPTKRRKS